MRAYGPFTLVRLADAILDSHARNGFAARKMTYQGIALDPSRHDPDRCVAHVVDTCMCTRCW